MRDAADTTAMPALRIAIRSAADGDDAELEAALVELAEDPAKRRS